MGRALDLVLSNITQIEVEGAESLVQTVDRFHPPLLISVTLTGNGYASFTPNIAYTGEWDFAKGDFLALYNALKVQTWDEIYGEEDVEVAVAIFNRIFNTILMDTIPQKNIKKSKQPIWINKFIIKKICKKEFYRKKFKITGDLEILFVTYLYEKARRESKKTGKISKKTVSGKS